MTKASPTPAVTAEQLKLNNEFLDLIIKKGGLKNDAALSRLLKVAPPVISKVRTGRLSVGASLMITIHEVTDMLFAEIREYIPKAA